MKIDTLVLEDHQAKLIVEVEPAKLEAAKQRAARKIAQKNPIPGFRPGKAPYPVVLRTFGEAVVLEQALDLLIDEIYPQVIEQSGIKPYGPGTLENIVSTDPPIFEFTVPLEAEVDLGDYQALRLPYQTPVVEEKEVAQVLEDLRSRQAILEPAERPAQTGDQVYIVLNGTRINPDPGESPLLVSNRSMEVIIDGEETSDPDEWPFPGFSRHLIGLSAGEEKVIPHTFSEDTPYQRLRGIQAEFQVKVEQVKSRTLPEFNDEFAQSVNEEFASLEALRQEIRKMLERQAQEIEDDKYSDEIISRLVEQATIKFSPQMLNDQIDRQVEELESRLASVKVDLDTYLKVEGKDLETLRQEFKPLAENRLRRSLVLLEVIRREKIKIPAEEIKTETERALANLLPYLENKTPRRALNKELVEDVANDVAFELLRNHTLERLRAIAKGEYKPAETDENAGAPAAEKDSREPEGSVEPAPKGETSAENGSEESKDKGILQ